MPTSATPATTGHRWPTRRATVARLVLAVVAAALLLTGALNVRAVFGDDDRRAWDVDPAAQSEVAALIGGPPRPASPLDAQMLTLQDRLRDRPDDARAAALLGHAYLQAARDTGDPGYYPKAEILFDQALAVDATDVGAMTGLGTLALARHRFADALAWGERAIALSPAHAPAHGVVVDALVELGRDDEAVRAAQTMVDLRPDLASYARVSYVRELHGDRPGAVAAMEQALVAAAGPQNVAWAATQVGTLRFEGGDLDAAARRYAEALAALPGFPAAMAGQARVAAARGDLAAAADLYGRALATMPLPEFAIARGDVLAASGRADEAAAQYALVGAMDRLAAANGVDTDLDLALFVADHGTPAQIADAAARVRALVAARPSVTANDTLAWVLFRAGDLPGAREASRQALRLGTQSPMMRFHAGTIAAALGDREAAVAHLHAALDLNPHFSVRDAPAARVALAALESASPSNPDAAP